jgi:hypothetical protein
MSQGKTALTQVQKVVMETLANDAALMALVPGGVWDFVPAGPVWPYLCLESADELPNDTYGAQGRNVTLSFTIFSNYQGRKEQYDIVDALVRLLRETRLAVDDWEHVATWHLGSRATSPFEIGNARAGSATVTVQVVVLER